MPSRTKSNLLLISSENLEVRFDFYTFSATFASLNLFFLDPIYPMVRLGVGPVGGKIGGDGAQPLFNLIDPLVKPLFHPVHPLSQHLLTFDDNIQLENFGVRLCVRLARLQLATLYSSLTRYTLMIVQCSMFNVQYQDQDQVTVPRRGADARLAPSSSFRIEQLVCEVSEIFGRSQKLLRITHIIMNKGIPTLDGKQTQIN